MKYSLLAVLLLLFSSATFAQQVNIWAKWGWLMGEWHGEGSGKPGQGEGSFTFKTDVNDKVLVRKSHSSYPAANNKPATVHDDLMIIYTDYSGAPSKAIYFDNEGHTINYSITYGERTIVLTSDKTPSAPVFRLTYTLLEHNIVNTKFEMSQDGPHL